jgi:osomolarity two-component system response regulator SKN7
MNDVLAKPFTKDGMVRILRKHLPYLLKNPPPPGSTADDMGAPTAGQAGPVPPYPNSAGMSMGQMAGPAAMSSAGAQMKFEGTPIQSPATSSSWHSPSQISHTSPALDNGGYMSAVGPGQGMILTPGGTQRPQYAGVPQVAAPTLMRPDGLGGMGDDRPEKRQRLYGPSQGAYSQ